MAGDSTDENSREIEVYGELGALPKVGFKLRLAHKVRVDRMIDSAAEHAELHRGELEDRLAESDGHVRDVVVMAALRARDVGDDDYLDVLGRLVAGALDAAAIDELALITAEITKLEPVHLRALFSLFYFGKEHGVDADPDLSPRDAAWASTRYRSDREVAHLLQLPGETASQVLLRLDRDGLIHLHGGPVEDGEDTSGPRPWACRVLSILFPGMRVEFRDTTGQDQVDQQTSVATAPATEVAISLEDSSRDHRAVLELEKEIKETERRRHSPMGVNVLGGDLEWLATLRRRLRRIDPDNPWAYDD